MYLGSEQNKWTSDMNKGSYVLYSVKNQSPQVFAGHDGVSADA